jgi:hypothetical protein
VYRRCLFCTADLGSNEVIEPFPVGRRLAFDEARGRLWVICRFCERWNLSPLEERWEAVEEAERIYRETPLRVSTSQIGLARHREGVELVRIGTPLRPEFAAWRYGDQFGRRRRRHVRNAVVGTGLVGGLALGSVGVVGGLTVLQLGVHFHQAVNVLRHALVPTLRVRLEEGRTIHLRPRDLQSPRLRPGSSPAQERGPGRSAGGEGDGAWHLKLDHREGTEVLTGQDAVRALRVILPRINAAGAPSSEVREAVGELEAVGDPEAYFGRAEYRARSRGWGHMNLPRVPRPIRLALEMAAHEDVERVALEGELAWLETAWREAEELAAIADDLTLPERVRIRFEEMKARHLRRKPEAE